MFLRAWIQEQAAEPSKHAGRESHGDVGNVGGEEDADSESVEQVFAQARDAEASAEEFLVDDGWKAGDSEPELEPVAVEAHTNGNAHRDAIGIGLTVKLVLEIRPETPFYSDLGPQFVSGECRF